MSRIECPCQSPPMAEATPIEKLEKVREVCSVLRQVYLPDDVWPEVKAWHSTADSVALHHSVFALALEQGHLARLTNPIHHYLLQNGAAATSLRAQYKEDLKERWMLHADHLRRHQLCRIYLGRITELQIVEWLGSQGWTITELEAFREGSDATAVPPCEGETDVEIKMVGTEDADFESIVQSLAGQPSVRRQSPYAAVNYLLFRVYEAAVQLQRFGRRRAAVVVISDWDRFQIQLEGGWVNWRTPHFTEQDEELLPTLKARYPDLVSESALCDALNQIDALFLLKRASGYEYQLEKMLRYRGPNVACSRRRLIRILVRQT